MQLPCRYKVAVTVNATIMVMQLGSITIALLKVLSDQQISKSTDLPRLHREAAFAGVSICTALAGFCIIVFGMQQLLGIMRTAAETICTSVRALFFARSATIHPSWARSGAPGDVSQLAERLPAAAAAVDPARSSGLP